MSTKKRVPGGKKKRQRKRKGKAPGSKGLGNEAPVAQATRRRYTKPKITHSSNGDTFVEHREFILDLASPNTANDFAILQKLPVNPGKSDLFPWLSSVALRYESYLIESLSVEILTEAPTTSPGSVFMAIDYDPTDLAPSSKQELLAMEGSERGAPWQNIVLRASKQDLTKRKTYYVGQGNPTTFGLPAPPLGGGADVIGVGASLRTSDVGTLFIGCQNCGSDVTLGELWVSYKVHFMTPTLSNSLPSVCFEAVTATQSATSQTLNAFLGITPEGSGNLDVDYSTPGGITTFTFSDPGLYFIIADVNCASGMTGLTWTFLTPVGGAGLPSAVLSKNPQLNSNSFITVSASSITYALTVHVPTSGGRVQTQVAGAFTTPGTCLAVITKLLGGTNIW